MKRGEASAAAAARSGEIEAALARLEAELAPLPSLVVAFSGGCDSTLLLAVAVRVLGPERVAAVTIDSPSLPRAALARAQERAAATGVRHRLVAGAELDDEAYVRNPPDRCYHCKAQVCRLVEGVRSELGFARCAHGANADDAADWRPGERAAREAGFLAPLAAAGLEKAMVRALSRHLGLPSWDEPAAACLASRIPYGEPITRERLGRLERAEAWLQEAGFRVVRVRDHGAVARLELGAGEIERAAAAPLRQEIAAALRALGFHYVALDLEGYRTGSLNAGLGRERND